MNRSFLAAAALAAPLFAFAASPAIAAKSPAMEACSAAWAKLREDGSLPKGQKWPDFWSKCNKEYKAQNNITAGDDDELPPEPKAKKKKTAKKVKKVKVAAVNEDAPDGTGALKKECDNKWKDHKASTGASGWKQYFTYMAKCM